MGADPKDSATNTYGQVWDAPNVFLTGAALFPQNPGMNPTGTVLVFACQTGDGLTNKYFENPREIVS